MQEALDFAALPRELDFWIGQTWLWRFTSSVTSNLTVLDGCD